MAGDVTVIALLLATDTALVGNRKKSTLEPTLLANGVVVSVTDA